MPLDMNEDSQNPPFQPNPGVLLVNGCIPYQPEQITPKRGEKGTPITLEQINLPEGELIWTDVIMTVVRQSIARELLKATSIQTRGRAYRAIAHNKSQCN